MATRIPTMYGRYYVISLVWRGRQFTFTAYRATLSKMQRPQAQKLCDKMYPGCRVISFHESDPTDGPVVLTTEEAPKGAKYDRMIKHIKKSYSKDGNLTKGEEGIAYATAHKQKNKDKKEEYDKSKNCGCGKDPCITYGKQIDPDCQVEGKKIKKKEKAIQGATDVPNYPQDQVSEAKCGKGEYFCNDEQKCKPIPEGHHVMPDGMLMKGKKHSVKEALDSKDKPKVKKVVGMLKKASKAHASQSKALQQAMEEGAAWTKKAGKNKEGGLNEKGRKSYERDNPGSDLKAPSKKKGNKRRASFCARMKGMKKKLTSAKTARDPDSRINKSLRAWNC